MATETRLPLLDQVRIASPCPMKWEDMEGGDRVRFCGDCRLQVFNLSDMGAEEAETLLRKHVASGERLCAGFFRRPDGTVMTRDCPVGLAAVRRRVRRVAVRLAAAIGLAALGTGGVALGEARGASGLSAVRPFDAICRWLAPGRVAPPPTRWIAGDVCVPMPNTPPTTTTPATGEDET